MKTIKLLVVAFFMLVVSLISITSVLAQEADKNWSNNQNVPVDAVTGWSDSMLSYGNGQTSNNAVSTAGGPVITEQPKDVKFKIPYPANMSISVENPDACSFQWQWQLDADNWRNFIGEGAQKSTFENKITNGQLDGAVVRCVVTSKSDPTKETVSNPATFTKDGEAPEYYATLGNQIVEMGQTVNLTEGGQASLSADGKTLTLNNAKVTYTSDYNSYTSGIGIQYTVTPKEDANEVKIQLIGKNTIFGDTEHSFADLDGVKKSFAGLYLAPINAETTNRTTLTIGGDGELILDSSKQGKTVFDFYGIYAESFVKLADTARVTINNKYIGVIGADFSMGENTALTNAADVSALLLMPSYDASANFTMLPGSVLDAQAKMGTVVVLKGDGEFKAEGATIKLLGKMNPEDEPVDQEPIVIAGVTTTRSSDASGTEGNMTLKNCQVETNLSTNNKQIQFQQGLRAGGDLIIEGGSLIVNSDILEGSVNSSGAIGVQGDNISIKGGADVAIRVNGSNMALGCIANEKVTISDAAVNTIIDNSAGKFSAADTEAIGIGAQTMDIGLSSDQERVNAQILGYDNGLPLVNFLESSDVKKSYDPEYQAERLILSDKAQFVVPTATEAVLNLASLEAHQVIGAPVKKYSVYEAVYNKNDTAKGAQQVTIAGNAVTDLVSYQTQIQNIGWQGRVSDGEISGTTGQSLRMEAININLPNKQYPGTIQYKSHIQNKGWETTFRNAGELSGTTNEGLRLEAIQIQLTDQMAEKYDVCYQVYAQNFGWLDWAKNGESAGTEGQSLRLEAIRIKIVPKGTVLTTEGTVHKAFVTLSDN